MIQAGGLSLKGTKTILYNFYYKPVTNPLCILKRSALPEQVKVTTATQELLRRWKTSSLEVDTEEMEKITTRYMDNLMAMGYTLEWRVKVLKSALVGYQRILFKVDHDGIRRNRKGVDTHQKRRFRKLCGQAEWYRVKQEDMQELEPWGDQQQGR